MLDLVLPRRCVVCASAGTSLCPACATSLPPAPALPPPPHLDRCWALLSYRDGGARLAIDLKHGRRDLVPVVGPALGALATSLAGGDGWTLTWAPTSAARRRARGYDQARLLARAAAASAGLPARGLLRRGDGPAQSGRDRVARLAGPSFRARRRVPGRVVVVDDVWTTGATLAAAARSLREAGASEVCGLALAVRP